MEHQALKPAEDARAGIIVSDGELLQRFVFDRQPEVFAELMRRHGAYVLGVCRRVTGHAQDAEDVFQACFLELVRRPASIFRHESVGGWLQTVAVRLSLKAKSRRRQRELREERGMANEATIDPADISWGEVRQIMEEELALLPDALRSVIIACLFEGRTQDEAAQFLDVNPRTIKDRLRRGRQMLRARLTRRGVTLTVMGTLLAGGSVDAAVSPALIEATLRGTTALLNKSALTGSVTESVLSLTNPTASVVSWTTVATWMLGLLLCSSMAFFFWDRVTPPRMQSLHRTFRGRQFDSDVFQWTGPNPMRYLRREQEGLRITLPAERGPGQPLGVTLRHSIRGDFEVEASFEFLRVVPSSRSSAGVTLYFFMDDDEWNGLWMGKMNDRERGPAFVTGHRIKKREERITKFLDSVETQGEVGMTRLRVVRKGNTFSMYAAEGKSSEFQHLKSLDISSDDVRILRFATDPSWSPSAEIDIRLIDFSLKAHEIVGMQQ